MDHQQLFRQDARVIGLVGLAHGTSHFYHLILAALIPWLKPEFNLSYSELGLLMTVFFAVSGVGQALAGFVVDRYSARVVLLSGVALLGISAVVLSAAQNYGQLMAGALLAGCGNCVFHPADYTLLNQRVSKQRLAHGFSVHGISGNIGWALSPLFLTSVAGRTDWRTALLCTSLLPLGVLALLLWNRHALRPIPVLEPASAPQPLVVSQPQPQPHPHPHPHPQPHPQPQTVAACTSATAATAAPLIAANMGVADSSPLGFLRLKVVWMCFAFFVISAIALAGVQTFAASSLISLYGMSLAWATSAYTCFMLSSAVGMLYGGFLGAAHGGGHGRHDRIIIGAFAMAAVFALILAAAVVPAWMAIVLMGLVGFATGIAGPSRDLMIRGAAPANATGRVFGVVYAGLDTGLAIGPLMFAALMDGGHPAGVFVGIAIFQVLVIFTTIGVGNNSRTLLAARTA